MLDHTWSLGTNSWICSPRGNSTLSCTNLVTWFITLSSSICCEILSPLPEANLLTSVLLWEGASHTQFCMENSLGTVGSSWVWAEPSEASPPRSSQSVWSTWRVSWSVPLVHSTISELWAYMQCVVSIWCLKFCLLAVLDKLRKSGHCPIQCW